MVSDFPYQLVGFLSQQPAVGEPVYGGKHGWYPQIALKRRFKLTGIGEGVLLTMIAQYCTSMQPLHIVVGDYVEADRMPVGVLAVEASKELLTFHTDFIAYFNKHIVSRYPDRDGENYYPHITAEYDGKTVIDIDSVSYHEFLLKSVWLVKDIDDEDSVAFAPFALHP